MPVALFIFIFISNKRFRQWHQRWKNAIIALDVIMSELHSYKQRLVEESIFVCFQRFKWTSENTLIERPWNILWKKVMFTTYFYNKNLKQWKKNIGKASLKGKTISSQNIANLTILKSLCRYEIAQNLKTETLRQTSPLKENCSFFSLNRYWSTPITLVIDFAKITRFIIGKNDLLFQDFSLSTIFVLLRI